MAALLRVESRAPQACERPCRLQAGRADRGDRAAPLANRQPHPDLLRRRDLCGAAGRGVAPRGRLTRADYSERLRAMRSRRSEIVASSSPILARTRFAASLPGKRL